MLFFCYLLELYKHSRVGRILSNLWMNKFDKVRKNAQSSIACILTIQNSPPPPAPSTNQTNWSTWTVVITVTQQQQRQSSKIARDHCCEMVIATCRSKQWPPTVVPVISWWRCTLTEGRRHRKWIRKLTKIPAVMKSTPMPEACSTRWVTCDGGDDIGDNFNCGDSWRE